MTAASTPPSSIRRMASSGVKAVTCRCARLLGKPLPQRRSEEHTSELQSHVNLVCRLLLEKKNMPRRGHRHGRRLPTPQALLQDDTGWPAQRLSVPFKNGVVRELDVKVVTGVCWYPAAGSPAVQVVLVRDPQGKWRNEALVCTDVTLTATEVITGYCRRWSVEVAFCDAKQ